MAKKKKEKSGVRDTWIPETWRYNGAGPQRTRRNELDRKRKHKKDYRDEVE